MPIKKSKLREKRGNAPGLNASVAHTTPKHNLSFLLVSQIGRISGDLFTAHNSGENGKQIEQKGNHRIALKITSA